MAKPPLTSIHWCGIILIFYTFISVISGSLYLEQALLFSISDPRVHIWKNYCILPVLFIITFSTVKDKETAIWILVTMCATMVLMDYYTAQQVMWYHSIESRVKIHGTFVYLGPNEVAAFYNQYSIIMLAVLFHMKKGWWRFGLAFLILINLYIVVFMFSRAAYAATFIGMFCLFLFKKRFLLIPLILTALCWHLVLPERVIERIEMTTGEYNELDSSSETRIVVWKDSLDLFSENPIFGVGFGVFRYSGFALGDTHNIYLKILAEQGIIGMFIFLGLLMSFFTYGMRLYRNSDDDLIKGLGLGFSISIIVLMVNNIFGNRWTYLEVSAFLWVTAGVVARLYFIEMQSKSPKLNLHQQMNK